MTDYIAEIKTILDDFANAYELWSENTITDKDYEKRYIKSTQALQALLTKVEKAYGGCGYCFGKGYATVNGRWAGYDADQDIGSPGGKVQGGQPIEMKFCSCDRGKQLKGLVTKARLDEVSKAMAIVEGAGASVELTNVIIKLIERKDKLKEQLDNE